MDRRLERLQLEGLGENRRLHSLEEKSYPRIIVVTGKKNEPLTGSRADPRHGPVEHFAPDLRHHHVANDEIEWILEDLAQTLDATRDRGYLKRAGNQVIVEKCSEIILIFEKQNPLAWPKHIVPRNVGDRPCRLFRVKIESDRLLHGTVADVRRWRSRGHNAKGTSKTGAVGRGPTADGRSEMAVEG